MDRRIVAGSLAALAGVALLGAPVVEWLTATNVGLLDGVLSGLSVLISVAIPVTGAVLVARRRPEGLAVLVAAALIAVPTVASLGHFFATEADGARLLTVTLPLYLVAHVSMVAAGAAAWGLRDADRWRWDRPVPSPYVALAVVALLPTGANLVTAHGVFFPVALLTSMNVLDVAILGQAVVFVALLVLGARLPRRTAAVLLLVLLVPRLYESVGRVVRDLSGFDMGLGPFDWLGMAVAAALVATACWWLSRGDDVPTRVEPTTPSAPVT